MYKILAGILVAIIVGGSVFYLIDRYSKNKRFSELHNEIAKLEGIVQETEFAYSRRGIELDNLKLNNKALRKIIKDRDEDIVALTETNLRLKKKIIEIENASGEIVGEEGEPVELPENDPCKLCEKRFKVSFDKTEDYLRVSGHTLTNPPYAQVSIEWARDLQLSVILTKNKEDRFRIYLDSENSDFVPTELKLSVDPDILKYRWYENIGFSADIAIGEGFGSSVKAIYNFENWAIGPAFMMYYNGKKLKKLYGVTAIWFPFR